ncbi:GAF domain-containing protein [Rhodohalobacter sulfatireducens]|uniref:GAF domain-containing protein n=1 Tax=Rhodohalobacter sulfatireducens TaxID=2911366 RepID=A0ABS9KBP5_9BACT|nr:GAF domain-containing protein [Rhodohalobacter sulfatireducens]MCG2588280.1 GAF domain-containing protein [Rhodohalobacter sulfatireducens]
MSSKREEKALLEFKHILDDLMQLVSRSTNAKTAYLYWVNRSRQQFVLETTYTEFSNVMFKDRIGFEKFFLDRFKEINDILQLEVGKQVNREDLLHYYNRVPTNYLTVIPFANNNSTVALTILETEQPLDVKEFEKPISAYRNAHINVLNTYLELTDLYDDQKKWTDYDESTDRITTKLSDVEVLGVMTEEMQKLLPSGGVSVVLRGMETWVNVLRSSRTAESPSIGLMVDEKSMAYDALQKGEAIFSIHFNQNPKRISASEKSSDGATLAIPVLMADKRCAVVLAHDKNPLTFKESTKHQLKNLVKIASLTIQANHDSGDYNQNLLATEYGNFQPELIDHCIQNEIDRDPGDQQIWFGLVGIENLSEIRSRFRLEDLKKLQRLMVKALNPSRLGLNGLIGFHSDYVYSYLLMSRDKNQHDKWLQEIKLDLKDKLDLGDGRKVEVQIQYGSKKIERGAGDMKELWNEVKHSLSSAMRNENATISGL